MARALGVDETNSRSTSDLLVATIADRRLLLVLDNFEHLTAAGPDITTLLEACPHLTVMATSRVRLRLRSEHEYPVMPLALPDRQTIAAAPSLTQRSQAAAVALFARRAMAARPGFALTEQNIALVEVICRRLDGLPLAIELAAPQVRMLAPAQLLQRLERPLDVLGTMAQDVPSRQRTLRTTIAWSHDLLTPPEQVLFRRLSVFAGGWPLEATEAMASVNGGTTAIDAVETLSRLIDHNLIQTRQAADDAELRYVMLETIREFAAEQLAASDEEELVRERHAAWVIDLAREAAHGLFGPAEIMWLDRLDLEHDNVRSALSWLMRSGDEARARAITSSLWWFWATRGYGREALVWIEQALSAAQGDAAGDSDRIDTLTGATWIAGIHGQSDQAARYAEQAVALARAGSDETATARALFMLSFTRGGQGDHAAATSYAEEALALFRHAGDREWIPFALNRLGIERQEQSDYAGAAALYEEALSRWRAVGHPWGIGTALLNLGLVTHERGDTRRAAALFRECVPLAVRQGDRWGLVELFAALADIAVQAGDPGLGARLLGTADRMQSELGIELQSYVALVQQRALEAARSALRAEAFASEWHQGRTWSMDEAIAGAMQAGAVG
jgi:predicted ATPase